MAPVGLQVQLTTPPVEIASATYNEGHYFAGMPKAPITDADLARAERIRYARELLKLNQSDVARAMKTSPQTVQLWEKGGGIRGSRQQQLAKVLRVTVEWLMFGNVNSESHLSPASHGRSSRAVRLDGAIVATAHTAIEWRLSLVGLTFDLAQAPDCLAAALNWALDKSPENLETLHAALEAEIHRQQRAKHASPKDDRSGVAGPDDARPGAKPARRSGK